AGAQDAPGPLLRFPADRVEHHIHIFHLFLETLVGVINYVRGAELTEEIMVLGCSRGDDLRTLPARKLDRVRPHTARRAVDQDPLSLYNLCMTKRGLPRREARQRNRGGLLEVQRMRLRREVRSVDRDEFGSAAIAAK